MQSFPPVSMAGAPSQRQEILMQKAKEMEAGFLAEMLSHGGLGDSPGSFGGGVGEEQFASFLRSEQARLMVDRGGIGLAEVLFRAMGGTENVK